MKPNLSSLALALSLTLALQPAAALAAEDIPSSGTAFAAEQTVLIGTETVRFPTYMLLNEEGDGTNYIRLRDLAITLNGTDAQFEVEYDGSIHIVTGTPYTAVGGEMTVPFSGNRRYTGGTARLSVDGAPADMTALTLLDDDGLGYTYFKLRDLGTVLNFGVSWDDRSKCVVLEPSGGNAAEPSSGSQAAMARAMLEVLARDLGPNGSIRFLDTDGDGVKELIVLDEFSAKLYDWNSGLLSTKEIGALAGGQIDWWLCRNTVTGEQGIEYQVAGGTYDSRIFFYPTRTVSLNHSYSDDGSSDVQSYSVDDRQVSQAEYNNVREQNRRLEYLLGDMSYEEPGSVVEIRAELECLAAGKTLQDISNEALLLIAQRLEDEVSTMDISIMNGWPTECDYSDFIMADIGGGTTECYRVIGYNSLADVIRTTEELWYQKVSRSDPTFELLFVPQIQDRYIARNGALYRHDLGMGDGGIVGVIDRLVSRTSDRAVFSGYSTYDGEENLGDFQISLVYEDGTWKYCSLYGAPDAWES